MTIPAFVTNSAATLRADPLYCPHPGEVFQRRCLSKTSLKQDEVAKRIGISTKHLSRFTNGHVSVGVELARKLEACTNISAAAWLHYQTQYDLYTNKKLESTVSLMTA
ncbi:HigA family addiction module antitoxin [Paraglaciecola arctica]|uniref:HigA family addiction module antitoxin n=1 Tax=Paraglaciecola arctica TaxID=1128911 RepID=UPI001C073F27|nr:HigA family addiction module antitoxin [Paraglaciecola arctica]MBU3005351.1 HigA family addiction module antidote protein [Paraglaciecola arctica]